MLQAAAALPDNLISICSYLPQFDRPVFPITYEAQPCIYAYEYIIALRSYACSYMLTAVLAFHAMLAACT